MKISVGMIIFNGDFVLQECLESLYGEVDEIIIAEGPVKYWQDKGHKTSFDNTNEILHGFSDPDHKIKIVHGQFSEKTEQCQAFFNHINKNNDYLLCVDSDEIHSPENLKNLKEILRSERPSSFGFRSRTFYGGFTHILGGFEKNSEFMRGFLLQPDCQYITHRPPRLAYRGATVDKHLSFDELDTKYNIAFWHYSYVFPRQVSTKIQYYKDAVINQGDCIPDYFNEVYLPWVLGNEQEREEIENRYNGVHEFSPQVRGSCRTERFAGEHPEVIAKRLPQLKARFNNELYEYIQKEINVV